MWWIVSAGVTVTSILYFRSVQVRKFVLLSYYEILFWAMGVSWNMEDIIYAFKNKLSDLPKRSHEVAIVTGGSRGIGLEVVKKLLECDMHVVIACRKVQAGLDAIETLRKNGVTSGTAEVKPLDTSSLKSVHNFANEITSTCSQLNILINNAGIMFGPYFLTEEGFESQLATNYLGHALLTHLLLPLLSKTGKNSNKWSRIVHVSSCAHIPGSIYYDDINFKKSIYIPTCAYAQSKLAQIMFSNALDRRLRAENAKVSSVCVHPGIVDTDLFAKTFFKRVLPFAPKLLFKTPEQGARPIVFCAISDNLEQRGGVYISNCRELKPSSLALNIDEQEKLIKKTTEMLNVTDFCET